MSKISYHRDGLGYIVLYGAASAEDVTYEQALKCIKKCGLKGDFLSPPTLSSALSRSIKAMQKDQKAKQKDQKAKQKDHKARQKDHKARQKDQKAKKNPPYKFAREALDTPDEKVVAIVKEDHKENTTDFNYEVETVAKLDKRRKSLVATGPDKEDIEEGFRHYYENVIGDDLRQMARKVVEALDGFSLRGSENVRDAGGTYFVLNKHAKQLEALSNVLEELKIGYLRAFGVIRGSVEQQSVFAASTAHVEREMIVIDEALAKLTTRASSARRHKNRLEGLKGLLMEYAESSQMPTAAEPSLSRLDAAIARAEKKIAQLTPKKRPRRRRTS